MRIWFNKTFSTIAAVFKNLRQCIPTDELTLICTQTHLTATAFLAADECYLEPSHLAGEEYLAWCIAFCADHQVDVFWPGKEAALFSVNHDVFKQIGVRVVSVADFSTLNLLHNKAFFYRDLNPNIAAVMDFIAVNNHGEFEQAVKALSVKHEKLCIKPAVSVNGLGFRILDIQRDSITHVLKGLEYHIPIHELRLGMMNTPEFDTLLVMEHLGGCEWSVDCVARHGELLAAVQRKKSLLVGHGQSIDNQTEISAMVSRLTQHYALNGIYNIQFKEGAQGIRLLEINPRPSGGFGMSCLSGVNLAHLAFQALKGEDVQLPQIKYGLKVNEINTPMIIAGHGAM